MRRNFVPALLAVVLAVIVPALSFAPVAAQVAGNAAKTLQLGRVEALGLGQRAIAVSRFDLAKRIAIALLQADPTDAGAMLLLSAAEARLGNNSASLQAADQAQAHSTDDRIKFEATFLKASAHAGAGNQARAKFYLRRAGDLAPDAAARNAIRQSHAQLANASRLQLNFSLDLGPSRNLNNGSLHDSISILPGFALALPQALSGLSYGGTGRFTYRLNRSKTSITELTGGLRYRGVALSGKAKTLAPSLRNSDLAYAGVDLGLTRRWKPATAPVAF